MSNMGARVARMFRNFNLENRVYRELSKEKPQAAPRHKVSLSPSAGSSDALESLNQKNDPLLSLLKSVYVESKDPASAATAQVTLHTYCGMDGCGKNESKEVTLGKQEERRPLRSNLPAQSYGLVELTDIPKGKLTLVEALTALSSYQRQPHTWTPEKISEEYSLDLKDTKAFLEFFIPFQVKIIPPKTSNARQIDAS